MNKIIANKLIALVLSLSMLISLVPSFSLTFTAETYTLDSIPEECIAENEASGEKATITTNYVIVYKSLDNGAEGKYIVVEPGTEITLVTKYTFKTDSSELVFYRYDYQGENTELSDAALSGYSGYQFIPAEYITPITDDGSTDSGEETEKTCNCGSSTSVHAATCPLYVAPVVCQICGVENGHASDCTTLCTCTPVDGVHQEGCLLYSETDGDDDDDSQITPTVCDKCGQASCICCTTCGNYPCTCPEIVLPEPSVTLAYPVEGLIAEAETSDATATINASYVNLYKSLDYGAPGICIPVEAGTQITLVTQYTFTTADGSTYTFYRYNYDGSNTDLYNACLSEISGYPFIYAGDVTFGNVVMPDTDTGVTVSGSNLPGDVSLSVEPKSLTDTGLDTNLYPVGDASLFYDVTLYQNGSEYQPQDGNTVTVTFPESAILANGFAVGDSYHVYHIHDGVVEMSAAAVYNGGDLDLVFANLSAVGIAGTEVEKNFLTDEGDIVSYTDYLDDIPATITDNSVVLYDYIEDGANGITVEGVADYSIILTQKIEYSTTGLVLYRFEYILDSTDSNYDADFYNIVNAESSSGGGYEYIPATYLTIDGEEDGTEILEEIFWELMETVSKEGYSEVLNKYTTELSLYAFTTEQQEVLDYHYSLIPNRADMIYTPWSGRVGPLMPPITLPSPLLRMAYAVSLADDTSDSSTTVDNTALKTSKIVTSNNDGTYTITIEAYAEGQVTVTTTKTAVDVILVLDMSSSMTDAFSNSLTREQAVEDATQAFVSAIISDGVANNTDHRVSVITYNTNVSVLCGLKNVLTNASTLNSAVSDDSLGTSQGTRSDLGIAAAIDVFAGDTSTYSFTNDEITTTTRQRVVIFFTDGYPSTSGSTNFNGEYAKDAINSAYTLKNTYGATVYSVAVLDKADPDGDLAWNGTTGTGVAIGLVNGYLHAVSSNYKDAMATYAESTSYEVRAPGGGGQGPGSSASGTLEIYDSDTDSNSGNYVNNDYYLTASTPEDLNDIFNTVSNTVISGGTSVNLGTETTVKDIVTPYFAVPANTSDVLVQSIDCTGYSNGAYIWDTSATTLSGTYTDSTGATKPYVSINGQTLDVSGFDFTHNFVAQTGRDEDDPSKEGSFLGRKLRITFTITPDPFFLGGNGVPTNESSSGIYDKDDVLYENLIPVPGSVDVKPIGIDIDWNDQNIYVSNAADIKVLFQNATVTSRYDSTKTEDLATVLNGENNAFVHVHFYITQGTQNIAKFTLPAGSSLSSGSWDTELYLNPVLFEDTTYSLTWDIEPVTSGTYGTLQHTDTSGNVLYEDATVYVYKPVLTFKDYFVDYMSPISETQYEYTSTSKAELEYETTNYVSSETVWKHGDTLSTAVTMHGSMPGLTLAYTPDPSDVSAGKVIATDYVGVNVSVKANNIDITGYTVFEHDSCDSSVECEWETVKNGYEFILHVENLYISLTINKQAGKDTVIESDETFIFTVKGTDVNNSNIDLTVVVVGTGSVEITALPVGNYTIAEDTGWTWNYENASVTSSITAENNDESSGVTDVSNAGSIISAKLAVDSVATFTNTKGTEQWLYDSTYVTNNFTTPATVSQ